MIVVAAFLLYLAGLAEIHGEAASTAAGFVQTGAPLASERAGQVVNSDRAEPERQEIKIRWLKADLATLDPRVKGAALLNPNRTRCVVIAPEITTEGDPVYVLGHEALHCLKGRFHSSAGEPGEIDQAREQMLAEILPALVLPEELEAVRQFLDEPEKHI